MIKEWQEALGGRRLLVSGFGKWGGGVYDVTSGRAEALDDLPTAGLAPGGGRLWRVLRAPGERSGTTELLSYDGRGVRTYDRLDRVRDPHDVCWFAGAPHLVSSWDDTVWRVEAGGALTPVWSAPTTGPGGRVPDAWHLNSLVEVGGGLLACGFGRTDRHKGWKAAPESGTGYLVDLRTGRDVIIGLCWPHTPRRTADGWLLCESAIGCLTACAPDGRILRRADLGRFTRGLAVLPGEAGPGPGVPGGAGRAARWPSGAGRWAVVGGNGHRAVDDDRAEVLVVDLATMDVVDRIGLPCIEVYDVVPVANALARGLELGFGANAGRVVDQARAPTLAPDQRPAPARARVALAPARVARPLAALGERLAPEAAGACGLRGRLPTRMTAGTAGVVAVDVVNASPFPLGSVTPKIVRLAARWADADAYADGDIRGGGPPRFGGAPALVNPPVPLPRVVFPGDRVRVTVPLEAPDAPGTYVLRVALRQAGLGWFGVRLEATVAVTPSGS